MESFIEELNKKESYHSEIMCLSIFVDCDDGDLKRLYVAAAEKHNNKIVEDPLFYDAGFDLFLPKNENEYEMWGDGTRFYGRHYEDVPINKVDFKIKCSGKKVSIKTNGSIISRYTPFYTYARSSISKTPLRLANNQGIIDAGYRGNLIGMFDIINSDNNNNKDFDWYLEKYSRILQICAPGLIPIYVDIVNKLEDLGPSTSRGNGGFGSTGK